MSEATVGAAAIGTDGASQLILSVFAVAFPTVVFGVFVWMLLVHPANLYPPDQYTAVTTIEGYVGALRRDRLAAQSVLETAIADAVSTAFAAEQRDADPGPDPEEVELSVAQAVDLAVKAGSVTVVRDQMLPSAGPVRFPVSDATTVQDLLDAVYFAVEPAVEPFTYGLDWWLVDEDGNDLPNMGAQWAQKNTRRPRDHRSLASVGLKPGATLTAVRRMS